MIKNLTVLLTTYNDSPYIRNAVSSILRQSFRDFELLIVDDGSTDNTEEVIAAVKDSRIRYVKIPHCGFSAAQNYGLKNATFDWIAKMDADDLCHKDRLKIQLSVQKNENMENIITCNSACFQLNRIMYVLETPADINTAHWKMALHPNITHAGVIYNRCFILKNGGYNNKLRKYEDYDLWLRLLGKSSYVVNPEILYFIRIRDNSLSNINSFYDRKIIYDIQSSYYDDFQANFAIKDSKLELEYRGWREYFFGDKNKVAEEWEKIGFNNWNFRMIIAYITTFLPEKKLHEFRELKMKLRIKYIFRSATKYSDLQSKLSALLD